MIAVSVVKKHTFANDTMQIVERTYLFPDGARATEWIELNPVDTLMGIGNGYQYEVTTAGMAELSTGYRAALDHYRDTIEQAHKIVSDPFKAPEINVEFSDRILSAVWALRVEYAAMMKKDD